MKKFVPILLLIMLLVPLHNVEAKTLQDYYNDLSKLEEKYNSAKNNKKLTETEINKLNNELTNINNNIELTKKDISNATEEIKKSEEEIENKKEETNEFLKFLQTSTGENVYLEYIFDADSYTDLIYRYAIVSQLSEYNDNLINELKTLVEDLEQKKKDLATKNTKLESQREEFASKLTTLRSNLSKATEEGANLEEEIRDLKTEINHYKDLGCSLNQDVDNCVKIAYATGFRYPLSYGCVTSEYTGSANRTDWVGGGGHYGIDLSCTGEGSPVYAAAAGTVALTTRYDCGGNVVYVYHVVNGVYYTTAYMHLLKINVTAGQEVTSDTVIGYMGGYSTSTEHGGYDSCTTGAHLHFGMALGHYTGGTNGFNAHSFNPREMFAFPSLVFNGGGYFYRK